MGLASGTRSAAVMVGLAAALAAPGAAFGFAGAADLFYERTVMVVADGRCRLFTREIGAALAASQAQARGAALRGGAEPSELADAEARARAAVIAQPCSSPSIQTAAGRVREAFEGYARMPKMTYPGDHAAWTADRITARSGRVWSLSQSTAFGRDLLTFGLAGREAGHELMAVVKFADGKEPYAARLVMRDEARLPKPHLDFRRANAAGALPLSARVAPRTATRSWMAEAKLVPDPLLASAKAKDAIAYRFPAEAARALSSLDPREAVEVEFLFASRTGRDEVRRAFIEVGDFAAGVAFLAAYQR